MPMTIEVFVILAVGYWLMESRTMGDSWRLDWETAAGALQDVFDLTWQLILLFSLRWAFVKISVYFPHIQFVELGGMIFLAYGLSLLRRRPEKGAGEPYFLALTAASFFLWQEGMFRNGQELLEMLGRVLGGSLVCEIILLGLKDRLRWSPGFRDAQESPVILLCLSIVALLFWSLRP